MNDELPGNTFYDERSRTSDEAQATLALAFEQRTANMYRELAIVERIHGKSSPQWIKLWNRIGKRIGGYQ